VQIWRSDDGWQTNEAWLSADDTRAALKSAAPVRHVAFSPDGEILWTVDEVGLVRVWQVADQQLLRKAQLGGDEASLSFVSTAFSPDGALVATGSVDGHIELWRAEDGAPKAQPGQHNGSVLALAFSPDGRWLASGSEDGTVRLWGVKP